MLLIIIYSGGRPMKYFAEWYSRDLSYEGELKKKKKKKKLKISGGLFTEWDSSDLSLLFYE